MSKYTTIQNQILLSYNTITIKKKTRHRDFPKKNQKKHQTTIHYSILNSLVSSPIYGAFLIFDDRFKTRWILRIELLIPTTMSTDGPIFRHNQRIFYVRFVIPHGHVSFKLTDKRKIWLNPSTIEMKLDMYLNGFTPEDKFSVRCNDGRWCVQSMQHSLGKRCDRCHRLHQDATS